MYAHGILIVVLFAFVFLKAANTFWIHITRTKRLPPNGARTSDCLLLIRCQFAEDNKTTIASLR